jgi:hypothetical protein
MSGWVWYPGIQFASALSSISYCVSMLLKTRASKRTVDHASRFKRKVGEFNSSRNGEHILFVTSRSVSAAFDVPKGTAVRGHNVGQVLTNLLTEDARESFEKDERMKMDNLRIGTAWNASMKQSDAKSTI